MGWWGAGRQSINVSDFKLKHLQLLDDVEECGLGIAITGYGLPGSSLVSVWRSTPGVAGRT